MLIPGYAYADNSVHSDNRAHADNRAYRDNPHAEQPGARTQIRTGRLIEPGHFVVEASPPPTYGPTDIMVRLEGCGVCASSLPVWEGRRWFDYPLHPGAPGHEGWGTVVATGEEVDYPRIGQRVACLAENAYAELVALPANHAVILPASLDGMPFPGEAIGCAMNIFRRSQVRPGHTVAIIGAGFLGLLLVQLSVAAGAQVAVFSRREYVRELAKHHGAFAAFDTEDWWGNAHKLNEMTNGHGCERVIEVTGLQFALDTATELVAEYGRLVIGGYHQDGLRQVNMQKWNWRAIDVINAHERDTLQCISGIRSAVKATEEGRIRPRELLTHSYHLDQLDGAFRTVVERPDGFIKGWVQL